VRITTRTEAGREAIEAAGAECWIGTPDRLATLRGSLENVTIACWLLACASGEAAELEALFTTRLELFLTQAIDTTVRGLLYEGSVVSGTGVPRELLAGGERIVRAAATRNAIPFRCLTAVPPEGGAWLRAAHQEIRSLLGTA
jgi:hypothetical protein